MEALKDGQPCDQQEYIRELENAVSSLRTFIDNSEAGTYVSDYYTGEVLYANRKTVEMFGYVLENADQMIGAVCWDMINKTEKGRCPFCPYKKLLDADGNALPPYEWENYFEEYDMWLRIISQAITWPDGRLAQTNTFYDITEYKRMQKELAEYAREMEYRKMQHTLQGVLDSLPLPARIADRSTGLIVYANMECARLFDFPSPEHMIGKPLSSMVAPVQSDGMDADAKINMLLLSAGLISAEMEFLTSKNKIIYSRVNARYIDYDGKKCSLAIITNLIAEKEQQKMLRNAAEKEKAANRLKSSFLSNMSHEIRTPMNAIIGLTEIELRKKHSDESVEVYKKINSSAKSLLQIVNDILDFSKIEADKMELFHDSFDIEEVLNNALLVVSPRLDGKPVELLLDISPDLPRYIIGDKTRLWQVLKNYLDNAAKYTQEGSIVLSVREDAARSTPVTAFISFTVSDTGVGMSQDQMQKAFLPYEQVYSKIQSRYEGTGLGMPLSKRICELMGGTIKVESHPGLGTSISFTLPFDLPAGEGASLPQAAERPDLSGLRVLVVDDSELSIRIIKTLLENAGAACVTARSGREAVSLLRKSPGFDVILLDYVMHEEKPLDTIRKIRKYAPESTKIFIVTAYGSCVERRLLAPYGVTEVLEKPFAPSLLYKKILMAARPSCDSQEPDEDHFVKYKDVRVLVFEDNEINQSVAEGMLDQFDIVSVFAGNGKAGIEILNQSGPFDLILMDIHMPVMDGHQATRAIRADSRFQDIPIISLTADAMSESLDRCLSSGMNDYLAKPFVMDDFHSILLKWLPKNKRKPSSRP